MPRRRRIFNNVLRQKNEIENAIIKRDARQSGHRAPYFGMK